MHSIPVWFNGKPFSFETEHSDRLFVGSSLSILESIRGPRLHLPMGAMQDVGPATQTLGGLLAMTKTETFASVERIAHTALVPISTARKHLSVLAKNGWIVNAGRGRTKKGAPRRTCTLKVTEKTTKSLEKYSILPAWAAEADWLTWADRAVLSVVMAKLAMLIKAIEADRAKRRAERHASTRPTKIGEIVESILPFGEMELAILNQGQAPWEFSLQRLQELTGLGRDAIIAAKRRLVALGILMADKRSQRFGRNFSQLNRPATPPAVLCPICSFRPLYRSVTSPDCIPFSGSRNLGANMGDGGSESGHWVESVSG